MMIMQKLVNFSLILGVALAISMSLSASASAQEKLSDGDRSRILAVADKLETNPLDDSLAQEREWALKRLIQAPDISVPMCPSILGDYHKYKYSSVITTQLLLGSAAFIIKNPDSSSDRNSIYLAGAK